MRLLFDFPATILDVFHYEATLANGKPIPDKDIEEFGEFIVEVLDDWGGTDDQPNERFIF